MLARTMLGVAERSQHLYGRALDIYLPARLEDAMLAARAMQRGGVGWYPNSHFIHLDSGPVRNWSLGEKGLGRVLLDNKPSRYFPDSIEISPGGEFYSRRSGQPVSPTDRLAIHRLLQNALGSPRDRRCAYCRRCGKSLSRPALLRRSRAPAADSAHSRTNRRPRPGCSRSARAAAHRTGSSRARLRSFSGPPGSAARPGTCRRRCWRPCRALRRCGTARPVAARPGARALLG